MNWLGKIFGKGKANTTSRVLYVLHFFFVLAGIAVVGKIFYIDFIWKPSKAEQTYFRPRSYKKVDIPVRGDILACDGRVLASAAPKCKIEMDCTVRKADFARDEKNGKVNEAKWRNKARELAAGLEKYVGGKSAETWYSEIISNRDKGRTSYVIADEVDNATFLKLKELPLFNEGKFKGGLIATRIEGRIYPYDALARRTIGFIRNNAESGRNNIGLESSFDETLHGRNGERYTRVTDRREYVTNLDSSVVAAVNGQDIRTTIDIDIQNIADREMRTFLQDSRVNEKITEGCCAVMEVETGAIRAMVNLKKNSDGSVSESYNYVIGRKGEPGSVFKAVTIMSLLEDGKIKSLCDSVPTFSGIWNYAGREFNDTEHLNAKRWPTGYIRIEDALMISCNNAFRYLAATTYEKNPEKYLEKIRNYGFMEDYGFDLEGLARTSLPTIDRKEQWTLQNLAQLGMGYAVEVTPLHLLTLYNGIANHGRLMKPYLVEDIEKNGEVIKKLGPKVLNSSMCRKSTADTLKRGFLRVTTGHPDDINYGTAWWPFRGYKCPVAGKTGTARIPITENASRKDPYQTVEGRRQYQATFVGFFPADAPKYTIICVGYSKPIIGNLYGSECAGVAKNIADAIYCMNPEWGNELRSNGKFEKASRPALVSSKESDGRVPDVSGMGLMDAICTIENCGYRCEYEGMGHVRSQSPAAHTVYTKGNNVKIILR
ncbi:MAG: hypothetical protein MJY56_05950 [Bacteroidales bacterium]|nr:hypothetical protein [Bacteroidales bacterium]